MTTATFKVTTAPRYPEDADDPRGDQLIYVDGQQIGGTYWCGADYIGDDERWASWGVAGLSMYYPTREAATGAQVREYAANPSTGDRLLATDPCPERLRRPRL